MQVIEKVKVVPEGYNGAGMNYDGCNRRDVNNYNALQSMVQAEVLNLVRGKIEASADGKHLLEEQLKLVKLLKSKIVEVTNKEMELFKAFKEASKTNLFYLSKF